MLTKVILEGVMGNKFGRVWNLYVGSAIEALRLIDANRPGLMSWIKSNTSVYARYKVVCTNERGQRESLTDESYPLLRKVKVIRFVPLPAGASGGVKFILGAAMFAVGVALAAEGVIIPELTYSGIALMAGGVAQMLTHIPEKKDPVNTNSNYFSGAQNTSEQGAPVPLVYGRVLVGSHAISASMTIDKLM